MFEHASGLQQYVQIYGLFSPAAKIFGRSRFCASAMVMAEKNVCDTFRELTREILV
jgi:hypothetical protein